MPRVLGNPYPLGDLRVRPIAGAGPAQVGSAEQNYVARDVPVHWMQELQP